MIKSFTLAFYIFIFMSSCSESKKSYINDSLNTDIRSDSFSSDKLQKDIVPRISDARITKDSILALSKEIIQLLKKKDFSALSDKVHPEIGLRFFPYGYLDTNSSRRYFQKAVQTFFIDSTIYKWGNYDGSGDEIVLSNSDYYKKFIYDVDFAKAPKVAVDSILGLGNSLINIRKVYPESHFVEYHFAGFDKQYGGMDWRSLRLILKVYNGKIYLIGISHDQWTS